MTSDALLRTLSIEFPAGKIKIDAKLPKVNYEQLLEEIYSKEFSKAGLMGWLNQKKVFSFTDESLVTALNKDFCDPIPDEPLDKKLDVGRKCASQPVAKKLRELAKSKEVPFHYVGVVVKVGIPKLDDQQPVGRASVCKNSEFLGQKIQLTNLRTKPNKSIEVLASGLYDCTGVGTTPDIQLNYKDAKELFLVPLDKFQEAVAVIL